MSQTKVFSVASDTVRRNKTDGSSKTGCGKSKHYYVGRQGSFDYDSFIKFTLDWTGVAKIVSAVLNIYTDEYDSFGISGEPGIMPAPATTDKPKVLYYRLTSAFTEGNNVDGNFDSGDYVNPAHTTSGGVSKVMTPNGAALLHTVDITAIVRAWAPASVQGGGNQPNHGIGLYGTSTASENWSGWSREHSNAGERATITLTYELGPTVPNTPALTKPIGSVSSVTTFEGDFSDVRSTDKLQYTDIEIYDPGTGATTSAAANTLTTVGNHGLNAGDVIYITGQGSGTGFTAFQRVYVLASGLTTKVFKVSTTSGGAVFDITADDTVTWSKRPSAITRYLATNTDILAAHFIVPKDTAWTPTVGRTYRWRARYTDNENQTSAWSNLSTFTLTNTQPNAPVLSPVDGYTTDGLALLKFMGGTFHDPDAGDYLMAHQVQMSQYPPNDARWDAEPDGVVWDTGKTFDPIGSTSWTEYYSGKALTAATYYWRARQWDQREGVSNWTYAMLVLTADFSPDPGSYSNVQINPNAPWRILIRNLFQSDGVTPTVGRGPGQLVAVFEEAKNPGASVVYNSPGEIHFTLLKDDQQIAAVQPKQTHYALEFYSGDGWQEKFAGVIWDVDATETDVVFKGIDYLALYDTVIDERYDPLKPNKSFKNNGSFYEDIAIRAVVIDQLNRAKHLTDSWVGFISIGAIAQMSERVTIYSTMQPTLSFIAGLLDSHRQGTGKKTRMRVVKLATGGYQVRVDDDPGTIRSDLAMYYGELVQGYRVIIFGDGWANVQHVVSRNRDGVKVYYQTIKGKPFQPATSLYGRIATVAVMDGVQDQNDLSRRGLQAAIQSAKLGKQIAMGIRTQFLAPLQGWDVCDVFPLKINDGAVNTDAYGSGYWVAYACAWEGTDLGEQSLVITFMPREDASAPDASLIPSRPLSTQPEWQLGWQAPDPLKAGSIYWYDGSSGAVYKRVDTTGTLLPVTGTP